MLELWGVINHLNLTHNHLGYQSANATVVTTVQRAHVEWHGWGQRWTRTVAFLCCFSKLRAWTLSKWLFSLMWGLLFILQVGPHLHTFFVPPPCSRIQCFPWITEETCDSQGHWYPPWAESYTGKAGNHSYSGVILKMTDHQRLDLANSPMEIHSSGCSLDFQTSALFQRLLFLNSSSPRVQLIRFSTPQLL